MKTQILYLFLTLLTLSSFGQITFEKGYFIDNENNRTECLINNYDWKNNPKEIEFRTDKNLETQKVETASIKEFGINGYSKYKRFITRIDRSLSDISTLSTKSSPEWKEEQLLLKVLVEGKASLYYYEDKSLSIFFYSVVDSVVQQLIYKEYLTEDNTIGINNKFRQQLWLDVNCSGTTQSSVESLSFQKKALEEYFKEYNKCSGNSFVEYKKKKTGELFNLSLAPGINYSNISIANSVSNMRDTDFGYKVCLSFGLEAEFILPFNKNKWGILFEPTYQYFNSTSQNELGNATINFRSLEFPIGLRYYFFLDKNLTLFINGLYIPGLSPDFNSTIVFNSNYATPLELKTRRSLAIGGGIGYSRFSAEIRYYLNKDILSDYGFWYTNYNRYSLLLRFNIL